MWALAALLVGIVAGLVLAIPPAKRYVGWAWRRVSGGATVAQRLTQFGPAARARLELHFRDAALAYPPSELTLIGIKDRKVLEVWAKDAAGVYAHVHDYPILAASGSLGPKLRQGDRQVPEGIYAIESLHPNSLYHLALRVDYPNEFDLNRGRDDGRTNLGGDIMIHGSNASVGCLAMGDEAAEDLFVLVADAGLAKTQLILTPVDFRVSDLASDTEDLPAWTESLYSDIRLHLKPFALAETASRNRTDRPRPERQRLSSEGAVAR
jgi:L,D-transpeptidase catalytic domain